jgi:hypothetical protein
MGSQTEVLKLIPGPIETEEKISQDKKDILLSEFHDALARVSEIPDLRKKVIAEI